MLFFSEKCEGVRWGCGGFILDTFLFGIFILMTDEKREQEIKEFKKSARKQLNEMSMKEIESHYGFMKQLLTISIAGIGFMGLIIRGESTTYCDARIIRFVIIALSLSSLSSVIYLFSQKHTYAELKKQIREHRDRVLGGNNTEGNTVFAKLGKFYVVCEFLSYAFFLCAVLGLIWYSIGSMELTPNC